MSLDTMFDYVIVGGGSAGCVLAARLSEESGTRVLLLEAGDRDRHPLLGIPLGVGKLHERRLFDWGFETEPEPGLGGRSIWAPRGKVLGGSSSVNMMAFTRGHPADYDRWAARGATGWGWYDVLPSFKRVESWERGESALRGAGGPVGVTFGTFEDPLTEAWFEAAKALGYPVTPDYNTDAVGFGRGQYSIRAGRRASAAAAYLRPALGRPNLTLVTGARARRILIDRGRATGVEYGVGGDVRRASATREVLVCSGAYNSPQLLMLSGVGPAAHLESLGITTVADLPVGRNLQEHVAAWVYWARRDPGPFRSHMRFDRMAWAMLQAHFFGRGVATAHPSSMHAFVKTQERSSAPDIEFLFRYAPRAPHLWFPGLRAPYADAYALGAVLLHPRSRGEVQLRSADPAAPVRIRLKALTEGDDLEVLRDGLERARALGESAALAPFRAAELSPGASIAGATRLDEWIRNNATLVHHPAGTCAMGSDDDAVLDTHLRVRGVASLRVVDASAMPDLVSAHINACVLMMAEKASEFIRSGR